MAEVDGVNVALAAAQQALNTEKQQSHAAVFKEEILKHTQQANSVDTTTNAAPAPAPASNVTSDKFAPGPRTNHDAGKFEIRVKDMQFRPANDTATASQSPEYRLYKSVPLKFGDRLDKTFDSPDTATAYARNVGENGAAVVAEGDHYAVYKLQGTGFWQPNFDIKSVASDGLLIKNDVIGSEGVQTMATKDGYVVDLSNGQSHVQLSGTSSDPFSAHKKVSGEGLEGLIGDRKQFEKRFELAMRDAAFKALDQSETATRAALQGLSADASLEKPAEHFTDADRASIDKAKKQMAPIDEKIIAKQKELEVALREKHEADRALPTMPNKALVHKMTVPYMDAAFKKIAETHTKVRRIQAELNQLKAERTQAAKDYPLMLRVEPGKMGEFNAKSEADQVKVLHKEARGVLNDIQTTRANLKDGNFNLWTLPNIRNTTAAGLGIKDSEQLKWIEDRAQHEQNVETAWKLGEAAVSIGLAVGGVFASGGTSLLLLGTSAALSVHSAVDTTLEYSRNNSATNTDSDPSAGLLPPDMKQHWGWVAAAWVGTGLDVGLVTSTVRALQAGKISLDVAAKTFGTDVKTLRATMETAKVAQLNVKTLDAAEFTTKYGHDVQAVTLLREGKDGRLGVEIISSKALGNSQRAAALTEEFAHLRQLNDPAIREKMLKLSEERLAGWKEMSASAKRDLLHTKLEVEADAQKILLKEGGPNVDKAMAQEHLTNIEAKLGELDEAAKSGRVPEWVEHADAPRLFSKAANSPLQGFTEKGFKKFVRSMRQLVRDTNLPDGELVLQGSRLRGTARETTYVDADGILREISDVDVALVVDEKTFFNLAEKALSRAHRGTRLERTIKRRIANGQLSAFDLGSEFEVSLRQTARLNSPYPVQFSVLKRGGKLHTPPFLNIGGK